MSRSPPEMERFSRPTGVDVEATDRSEVESMMDNRMTRFVDRETIAQIDW
ncbi:hypothetical protein ACDY97_29035 [Rhizobium mongolense]|nr:hypothetical protein [Rhizobium sp. CC1099]WFU86389.1 hypothetical protein QA644_14795 [Rhizobium sp. CC1099]